MSEVTRTGLACRRCNTPNAIANGGRVVEGLPVPERTPGDKVYCGTCIREMAAEVQRVCDKCEQLSLGIAQIGDKKVKVRR